MNTDRQILGSDAEGEASSGLVKLSGTIRNYRCTRASASFVFTDDDRYALGVVAVAAGLAGLSGQAIATASAAASADEEADYVEFELDGQPVKGWVWRSPFKEGDQVEVAAEWQGEHYEAGGIARPADRMIALYPHCSRGKSRHIKNAVKWWFIGVSALVLFMTIYAFLMFSPLPWEVIKYLVYMCIAFYVFFGMAAFSMAYKWMPFVRLTEKVTAILQLPDASNIDLVKSSKLQRQPDDPGEYGTFYFRY